MEQSLPFFRAPKLEWNDRMDSEEENSWLVACFNQSTRHGTQKMHRKKRRLSYRAAFRSASSFLLYVGGIGVTSFVSRNSVLWLEGARRTSVDAAEQGDIWRLDLLPSNAVLSRSLWCFRMESRSLSYMLNEKRLGDETMNNSTESWIKNRHKQRRAFEADYRMFVIML